MLPSSNQLLVVPGQECTLPKTGRRQGAGLSLGQRPTVFYDKWTRWALATVLLDQRAARLLSFAGQLLAAYIYLVHQTYMRVVNMSGQEHATPPSPRNGPSEPRRLAGSTRSMPLAGGVHWRGGGRAK